MMNEIMSLNWIIYKKFIELISFIAIMLQSNKLIIKITNTLIYYSQFFFYKFYSFSFLCFIKALKINILFYRHRLERDKFYYYTRFKISYFLIFILILDKFNSIFLRIFLLLSLWSSFVVFFSDSQSTFMYYSVLL